MPLEARVVLSRVGLRAAALAARNPAAIRQAAPKKTPPVVARINQAFDAFIQDYSQARGAYLASLDAQSSGEPVTLDAFNNYTANRVRLLGQQLSKSFFHVAANNKSKQPHGESAVRFTALVGRKVSGPNTSPSTSNNTPFADGTLGRALFAATPKAVGQSTSAQAANGLNVLAQDQAIATSRAAVINGFSFVKATALSGKKSD
jgi:hypothetical protein